MADYYVRKTGLDSNDGLTAGAAFLTIDKAANTVTAGSTVWVGAGVYREQVTMDTAGTSGNVITYIADVTGENALDPGLVVISAFDNEYSAAARSSCWNPTQKEFITVRGFVMTGGTLNVIHDSHATSLSYEEVMFEDCVLISGDDDSDGAVSLDVNATTSVPTTVGLTLRRCVIVGSVLIQYDENGTSESNIKMVFDSNLWVGLGDTTSLGPSLEFDKVASSTWSVGGITIANNTFYGVGYGIYVEKPTATTFTNPITVRNNYFAFADRDISMSASGSEDFIDSDYNLSVHVSTNFSNVVQGPNDRSNQTDAGLLGGIADMPLYRFMGWSPYRPWEPITLDDGVDAYTHAAIGAGDTTVAPAFDVYNETRPMGARVGTRVDSYYFDASDAGPTDEGTVWTGDANAFDGDTATSATTSTVGSASTNRLLAEGTNAPATGGTILDVERRVFGSSSDGTGDMWVRVYTDGEGELLWNTSLLNLSSAGAWNPWASLTVPSGGWTWAKIQALETYCWMGGGTDIAVHAIEIRVTHTAQGQDDQGAVEARTRPVQDTASVMTGVNSVKFLGAGYQDWLVPVLAQSTTVAMDARFDSNYTGSKPILEVLNITGVADQSDVMTSAADTTEELTVTFTPTAAGVCRVRVRSQDTSVDGEAFFDDLTVT